MAGTKTLPANMVMPGDTIVDYDGSEWIVKLAQSEYDPCGTVEFHCDDQHGHTRILMRTESVLVRL